MVDDDDNQYDDDDGGDHGHGDDELGRDGDELGRCGDWWWPVEPRLWHGHGGHDDGHGEGGGGKGDPLQLIFGLIMKKVILATIESHRLLKISSVLGY